MSNDPLAWSVTDREVAYSCPGFDVVREEVILPDGTATDFDYLVDPPSVVILPFTDDGEVVIIEEWRQSVKRRNRGFPAGSSEPTDTTMTETARRELREETGYEAEEFERLGAFEPANGLTDIEHHYFVASDCTRVGDPDHDPDESIEVDTTSWSTLRDAVLEGSIRDGRTVLGVSYYEARYGSP